MLFDTDVLIWLSRGDAKAVKAVNTDSDRVISAVTYMEFLAGCESKQKLAAFQKLLDAYDFEIIEISSSISAMADNLVYQYSLSHTGGVKGAAIPMISPTYHTEGATLYLVAMPPRPSN